jgi:hypothetical protein
MRELIIVGAVLFVLAMLGLANTVHARTLFDVAIWLVVGGFVVAVPAGVAYHVLLYRALAPTGSLEKGWVWRPIEYVRSLEGRDRRRILPWVYVSGSGFVLIVLGLVLVAVAMMAAWSQLSARLERLGT